MRGEGAELLFCHSQPPRIFLFFFERRCEKTVIRESSEKTLFFRIFLVGRGGKGDTFEIVDKVIFSSFILFFEFSLVEVGQGGEGFRPSG